MAARSPENAAPDQVAARLRALLAERFKLVVHTETKEQPIYALVLARADGKLGPQIKPSTLDCSTPNPIQRGAAPSTPPPSPAQFTCGTNTSVKQRNRFGHDERRRPIARGHRGSARKLRSDGHGRRPLRFDWHIRLRAEMGPDNLRTAAPADAATPDGPSIFTAVREQLGLRLEAQRGPVDFLVIDSISQPTPD